ncbi:hypothetical protein [Methanococcoides sp. LMO-2]|uniref:Uncharacterized protein n=1 Tax=Methanococcoides cohabitans TaxID=3136559 RepID=A0ABU9KXP3_9EURY
MAKNNNIRKEFRKENNAAQRDIREIIGTVAMILGFLLVLSNATTFEIPYLNEVSMENSFIILVFGFAASGYTKMVESLGQFNKK